MSHHYERIIFERQDGVATLRFNHPAKRNAFDPQMREEMAEVFTTHARLTAEGPGQWLKDQDGSALVIHANADDHTSQPIGGAGDRVACGVIGA